MDSNYNEKLIEHLFIADIITTAWFNGKKQIEISRSEVDNSGYDLILECNKIMRHVQLKSSKEESTTFEQKINIKLEEKPNGCVIWIIKSVDNKQNKISLRYMFYGDFKGGQLPPLKNFKNAKSNYNASGEKSTNPNKKIISKGKFQKITDTKELLKMLFEI